MSRLRLGVGSPRLRLRLPWLDLLIRRLGLRRLVRRGAQVLFVPSAFTAYTGPHHWLPLLRARAIENQCWVVAPAQVGQHNPDRRSHGESVVVDPWGKVVARKPRGQGWISAEIDLTLVDEIRRGLPCLDHLHPSLFR